MTFYDALLRCYPRSFRERFGADMRRSFEADLATRRTGSRISRAWFLFVTALHALWFGTFERLPKGPIMRSFFQFDVRAAYKSLRATPVVTAIALASLALGIGANTALFSILNGLVLKTLPVRDPERLVLIDDGSWTNAIWEQVRPHTRTLFDGGFAWSATSFDLAESGRRDMANAAYASGEIFDVLGVQPVLGRTFTSADDVRGGGPDGPVAVISYGFWKTHFGGAPSAVGERLLLNRKPFTVIGVLPSGFFGIDVGRVADVIVPIAAEASIAGADSMLDVRQAWWMEIYLREKPGQTLEQATLALRSVQPAIRDGAMPENLDAQNKAEFLKAPFTLIPGATGMSSIRARYQNPLTIVMVVVVAVLMIACANIANLLMARATARRQELSLRLALGASRFRIGRQLFTESLLLALAGALIGLGIAKWGSALLVNQLATSVNRVVIDLALDWRVLGFTTGIALATTLLFGLAPAFGVAGIAPHDALKEQSRSVAGDRRFGLRSFLVVAQLALSLVLVVGAGLFVRTFNTLVSAPLGFEPSGLLIANVTMSAGTAGNDARIEAAHRFAEAANHVPGVESAAISFFPPMSGVGWNDRVTVRGGPQLTGRQAETWVNGIDEQFFSTYKMRLLAGRTVTRADTSKSQKVAVVNEAFVKKFIGDGAPAIGRVIVSRGAPGEPPNEVTIVGVVNDSVYRTVRQGMVATMFTPFDHNDRVGAQVPVTIRVAANGGGDIEPRIAAALKQVDGQAAFTFRSFDEMLRGTLAPERITALLSAFFGGLAMLLAGIGLYGVTSYSVNRRRTEIAVRMALGASATGVVRSVLGRVGVMVLAGVAVGAALSVWLSKFVQTLIFGLPPRDVKTLILSAAVLTLTGIIAGWLPARRASRLDPTAVLRE
jgi:putative ABC transport system permease protein